MTDQAHRRRASGVDRPQRMCVGCRRVSPQATLLRVVRTAEGFVAPDPGRASPGRGAYLCHREACLTEALRRGRWAQAFRARTAVDPEAIERVRALLGAAVVGRVSG